LAIQSANHSNSLLAIFYVELGHFYLLIYTFIAKMLYYQINKFVL